MCNAATSLMAVRIEDKAALLVDSSSISRPVYGNAITAAITDFCGDSRYGIFVCQGCGGGFVAINRTTSDNHWTPVYPIAHKLIAKDIPDPIKGDFEEANLCFAVNAYRACVIMCQVSLEALWREQNVSNFAELQSAGIISSKLRQRADEIRLWNNIVKHDSTVDAVSKDECEELIEYMSAILETVYVEPKRFERLQAKRKEMKK